MKKKNLKKFKLNKTNISSVTDRIHGGAQGSGTITLTPITIEITTKIVTFMYCQERSAPNTNCNCGG
ncbi:hypothetical protein [Kordia sp.]|uniref:hypothetical protein n=1 Tax=Kordia sp. TaxID=1965332 RepID=UPI003B5B031B